MLGTNPFTPVKICRCDGFSKEAGWSKPEQDKVRQEGQTENDGKKKGRVRGAAISHREKQDD